MHIWRVQATATLALAAAALSACSSDGGPDAEAGAGALTVVTALYPLEYVARAVGGDDFTVSNLAAPGVEPHDIELSPQQVAAVAESSLVLYLGGFSPAFDEAAEQNAADRLFEVSPVVDLAPPASTLLGAEDDEHGDEHGSDPAAGDSLSGLDPHFWLDPTRLASLAEAVADRFSELSPERATEFRARADSLGADLEALDAAYASGLADCNTSTLVTSHDAFGYLTGRYGLEQVSVAGLEPDAEPSGARIKQVQDVIRATNTTTIFFEPLATAEVADTIAADLGVTAAPLDPLESRPDAGDYLTAMTENLQALQAGLDCAAAIT